MMLLELREIEDIRTLTRIRNSAVEDLRSMPAFKAGTEWERARQRDILLANEALFQMGAMPPVFPDATDEGDTL